MGAELQQMVEHLLAGRFGLRTHTEHEQQDVYVLQLAREDKRLGPNLIPTTPECVAARKNGSTLLSQCLQMPQTSVPAAGSGMRFLAAPVSRILIPLKAFGTVGRPIIDRTGLDGLYDISLFFDLSPQAPDGVSVFTALREQLGLKLTRAREMVDVLVIDAASMPEPD
jgi:uncharacterized protein (TIGR03435 family)